MSGPTQHVAAGRQYAGRSSEQRRAERRERMLAAGLDLFGGPEGWTGSPIERVCAVASVATRSFYEEFSSREELLLAVYEQVLAGAGAQVTRALASGPPADPGAEIAPRIRAGIGAYVDYLAADPRRARVAHVVVRAAGSPLEVHRHAAVVGFARLIETEAALLRRHGHQRPDAGRLTALALAGAVNELLIDWALTEPAPPTAPVVDELTRLFVAALS